MTGHVTGALSMVGWSERGDFTNERLSFLEANDGSLAANIGILHNPNMGIL